MSGPVTKVVPFTSSATAKVVMGLFVLAGFVQTLRQAWYGEDWFLIDFLSWGWMWVTKATEALRT